MTVYQALHSFFNVQKRFTYPYAHKDIPNNGIYVMFQKGEHFSTMERIVRIGTHTGLNRLPSRLDEHFIKPDHRDSIFRKHIGRCFLKQERREDYIPFWNLEIKSAKDKASNLHLINWELESIYETKVSDYIQNNFSFAVIPNIIDALLRRRLERGLIATLAQANERHASANWFGERHSSKAIKNSKLWNIHHVTGETLTPKEINFIVKQL